MVTKYNCFTNEELVQMFRYIDADKALVEELWNRIEATLIEPVCKPILCEDKL